MSCSPARTAPTRRCTSYSCWRDGRPSDAWCLHDVHRSGGSDGSGGSGGKCNPYTPYLPYPILRTVPTMIKSMTGFAAVTREDERATVAVTIRALNHRYLDL